MLLRSRHVRTFQFEVGPWVCPSFMPLLSLIFLVSLSGIDNRFDVLKHLRQVFVGWAGHLLNPWVCAQGASCTVYGDKHICTVLECDVD